MQIAVPRGRMLADSLKLLKRTTPGLEVPDDRDLIYRNGDVELLFAKPVDVPVYVESGVDVGITGKDVLLEGSYDVFIPTSLPFGECRLSLATLKGEEAPGSEMDGYRIATEFPKVTNRYFDSLGVPVEIIEVNGATELAPRAEIADAIVDIVKTGETLKANGLVEMETITESSALLLVNRIAGKTKFDEVNKLVYDVREVINRGFD